MVQACCLKASPEDGPLSLGFGCEIQRSFPCPKNVPDKNTRRQINQQRQSELSRSNIAKKNFHRYNIDNARLVGSCQVTMGRRLVTNEKSHKNCHYSEAGAI